MNINDAFPSKYLKATDLRGQAVKVQITHVTQEIVGGESKPVMYFAGKEKGCVLNKINSGVIASRFGDETDEWGGAELELYPDKTGYEGRIVDCIRVRLIVAPAAEGEETPF
jgi:hypothetical protein